MRIQVSPDEILTVDGEFIKERDGYVVYYRAKDKKRVKMKGKLAKDREKTKKAKTCGAEPEVNIDYNKKYRRFIKNTVAPLRQQLIKACGEGKGATQGGLNAHNDKQGVTLVDLVIKVYETQGKHISKDRAIKNGKEWMCGELSRYLPDLNLPCKKEIQIGIEKDDLATRFKNTCEKGVDEKNGGLHSDVLRKLLSKYIYPDLTPNRIKEMKFTKADMCRKLLKAEPFKDMKIKLAADETKIKYQLPEFETEELKDIEKGYPRPYDPEFEAKITKKFRKYKLKPLGNETGRELCKAKVASSSSVFDPLPYQHFIEHYISPESGYRGLLVYHGMGSGKTCSSIITAMQFPTKRKIVVLLKGSLRENFYTEMGKCGPKEFRGKPNDAIRKLINRPDGRFFIYAYNSDSAVSGIRKMKKKGMESGLDGKFLIVDEVHNLVSMIANPEGKRGKLLLTDIMMAKDLKILFLSGTPIINKPFELAILFNMLRRGIFPYTRIKFDEQFLGHAGVDEFKRRIRGLVSYYVGAIGRTYATKTQKLEAIEMSTYQFKTYAIARLVELERDLQVEAALQILAQERGITYEALIRSIRNRKLYDKGLWRNLPKPLFRVFSRQMSNFAFPEKILNLVGKDRIKNIRELEKEADILGIDNVTEQMIDKLREKDLQEDRLGKYSPKLLKVLEHIKASPGPVLCYTPFKRLEGLDTLNRVLRSNGIKTYMYHGGISAAKRRRILERFNDPKHKHENVCFLCTDAGSEGISLRFVRQVHILEPLWNIPKIDQVIARAVRICSHYGLKEREWTVDIWIYISNYDTAIRDIVGEAQYETFVQLQKSLASGEKKPEKEYKGTPINKLHGQLAEWANGIVDKKWLDMAIRRFLEEVLSTNAYMYKVAMSKHELAVPFVDAMRSVAVDCRLNIEHNKTETFTIDNCFVYPANIEVNTLRQHLRGKKSAVDATVPLANRLLPLDTSKKPDVILLPVDKYGDLAFKPSGDIMRYLGDMREYKGNKERGGKRRRVLGTIKHRMIEMKKKDSDDSRKVAMVSMIVTQDANPQIKDKKPLLHTTVPGETEADLNSPEILQKAFTTAVKSVSDWYDKEYMGRTGINVWFPGSYIAGNAEYEHTLNTFANKFNVSVFLT